MTVNKNFLWIITALILFMISCGRAEMEQKPPGEPFIHMEFINGELPEGKFEIKIKGKPYLCTERNITISE